MGRIFAAPISGSALKGRRRINQILPAKMVGTAGGALIPPDEIHLNPGSLGEYCVLRWASPTSGQSVAVEATS